MVKILAAVLTDGQLSRLRAPRRSTCQRRRRPQRTGAARKAAIVSRIPERSVILARLPHDSWPPLSRSIWACWTSPDLVRLGNSIIGDAPSTRFRGVPSQRLRDDRAARSAYVHVCRHSLIGALADFRNQQNSVSRLSAVDPIPMLLGSGCRVSRVNEMDNRCSYQQSHWSCGNRNSYHPAYGTVDRNGHQVVVCGQG